MQVDFFASIAALREGMGIVVGRPETSAVRQGATGVIRVAFLAVVLCLANLAWAQEEAQEVQDLGPSGWLFDMARNYQALIGTAIGVPLGALGKWFFDQWSAERAARREFAMEVTAQISDLAKEYYWSLANYAGVLAGLLESYLDSRAHHLLLLRVDRKDLDARLDVIAGEIAQASFYHFCRLVGLFDKFQFRGSNTYLLKNHAAGEACKQLYNAFVSSLPSDDDSEMINTQKIVQVLRKEMDTEFSDKKVPVSELPSAYFSDQVVQTDLKDEFDSYRKWIRNSIPDVEDAATTSSHGSTRNSSRKLLRIPISICLKSPTTIGPTFLRNGPTRRSSVRERRAPCCDRWARQCRPSRRRSKRSRIASVATSALVRPILGREIRLEFPSIAVVSYGELSPNLNIQPLDRIYWEDVRKDVERRESHSEDPE